MTASKPGAALTAALKAADARKHRLDNAAANKAIERMFVRDSEMTPEQHALVQPDLRRAMYARNPRFLGSL